MSSKTTGKNVWVRAEALHYGTITADDVIISETRPASESWYDWAPAYAKSRVRGSKYTAYQGNDAWSKAANESMADHARGNFERTGR